MTILGSMKLLSLPLCVLISTALAQDTGSDSDNPEVEIQSCSDLSCIDDSTNGVCRIGQQRAIGVGMAGKVISVKEADTSLSLTLVDGNPSGIIGCSRGYQFSTQTLYVGVPPDLDPQDQPSGRALMMQYQGSTFPDANNDVTSNTTACGNIMTELCRRNLAEIIQHFRFNTTIKQLAGFTNVTGGTILGAGAASEATQLQKDGCQPVLPEQRSLYKVAEMKQLLYAGEQELVRPAEDDDDHQRPLMGAGRSRITPVVTVLYDDSDSQMPDVQFACMRTFTADGGELPDTLNFENSAKRRLVARLSVLVAVLSSTLVTL